MWEESLGNVIRFGIYHFLFTSYRSVIFIDRSDAMDNLWNPCDFSFGQSQTSVVQIFLVCCSVYTINSCCHSKFCSNISMMVTRYSLWPMANSQLFGRMFTCYVVVNVRSMYDSLASWHCVYCNSAGLGLDVVLSWCQRSHCQLPTADLQNCLCPFTGKYQNLYL